MLSTLMTPVAITLLAHPIHLLFVAVMAGHGIRALFAMERAARTAEERRGRARGALVHAA